MDLGLDFGSLGGVKRVGRAAAQAPVAGPHSTPVGVDEEPRVVRGVLIVCAAEHDVLTRVACDADTVLAGEVEGTALVREGHDAPSAWSMARPALSRAEVRGSHRTRGT
jgi:hypothetical protein